MSTAVYDALACTKLEWICCQCGLPNFSSSLFANSDLELSNSFDCLSTSSDINSDANSCIHNSSTELPSSPLASSSPTVNKRKKPKGVRKQLKVLVVNFQGLRSKSADLACCIEQHSPDIIIGSETHLDPSINNNELFPQGYSVIRKDRDFGPSKGGVLLAFKDDLVVTHRTDLNTNCEVVWATIQIQGAKQITIGSFYRSQQFGATTEYIDQLRESLNNINQTNGAQIWLAGDFNIPDIDWENYSVKPNARYANLSRKFLDLFSDFGLEQLVRKPTRINNILDIFLTNNQTLVEDSAVIPGISDHDAIPIITINIKPKLIKQNPRKIFLWNKANTEALKADLRDFSAGLSTRDISQSSVENLYCEFVDKINLVMEEHIPSRIVREKIPPLDQP
ncbi:uncharacterized protein [Amphiura filiformis]|uniref:uncharacterized protein n=1 Tax=Amphiura filiformis TaxID=82378 RepID=UPI003B21E13A